VKAVLDTNIVISGALTAHGRCAQILDLLAQGSFGLYASDGMLAEYDRVLHKPNIGIDAGDADEISALLHAAAHPAAAMPLRAALPHEADRPFIEVAAAADAVLVTGNLRHFPEYARAGVTVLGPNEFLDLLRRSS
jgi:predicted nucleic acid-binding protein